MASHSPQRTTTTRKVQSHLVHQGPPRDPSRSPSFKERPRITKGTSMPSVHSLLTALPIQPSHPSPTTSVGSGRRSPPLPVGQMQRGLPTPPHPTVNIPSDVQQEAVPIPSPHHPRPIAYTRNQLQFLRGYHESHGSPGGVEVDNWQMTEELLADIEKADQQQAMAVPTHKDPTVERVRSAGKSSPRRERPVSRDRHQQHPSTTSPVGRDRNPSPRGSPTYQAPPGPPAESYAHSPARGRGDPALPSILAQGLSLSTQTPPLQAMHGLMHGHLRTPDKSLPVREEAEEARDHERQRRDWERENWLKTQTQGPAGSPVPSSDLNPEGPDGPEDGRSSRAGHRDDEDDSFIGQTNGERQVGNSSSSGETERTTPRSPTSPLPPIISSAPLEDLPAIPVNNQGSHRRNPSGSSLTANDPRGRRSRAGITDHLGMRGIDMSSFVTYDVPTQDQYHPQYDQQRQAAQTPAESIDPRDGTIENYARYFTPQIHPDDYPLLMQSFLGDPTSPYLQPYLGNNANGHTSKEGSITSNGPRPDAPIPPTPHSLERRSPPPPMSRMDSYQTRVNDNPDDAPPFSPVNNARATGSPYPYPFTHVRRNLSYSSPLANSRPPPMNQHHSFPSTHSRSQSQSGYSNSPLANVDPAAITEAMARQYQMYAQNNFTGSITDSTLSPSSTPFPPATGPGPQYFNQWANWHTHRVLGGGIGMGRQRDMMSIRSSPSHEPIQLPKPPTVGLKKRERDREEPPRPAPPSTWEKPVSYSYPTPSRRKPPPRVDSTQPRDTSPEPSSSGEETAGEHQPPSSTVAPEQPQDGYLIKDDDGASDWIDEEDEEDMLEYEYHPTYVSNVEKRRRRWETKLDALIQAFQQLDRQTDATMVLLAAPSHSPKFHMLTSRSVRRQPVESRQPMLRNLQAGFRQLADHRLATRSPTKVNRLFIPRSGFSGGEGSPFDADMSELELKRALSAALGSLTQLESIYQEREARWLDEMRKVSEDRERVELILRQTLEQKQL